MTLAQVRDALRVVPSGQRLIGVVDGESDLGGPTLAYAMWCGTPCLDLHHAPYVLYGVNYIDLVSLGPSRCGANTPCLESRPMCSVRC